MNLSNWILKNEAELTSSNVENVMNSAVDLLSKLHNAICNASVGDDQGSFEGLALGSNQAARVLGLREVILDC